MTFNGNPKPVQFIEPNVLDRACLSVGKHDDFADPFGLHRTVLSGSTRSESVSRESNAVRPVVADDDNEAGGLADCPELYSSRRIFRLLRLRKTEGNSNEKDNRVWGVGPVA